MPVAGSLETNRAGECQGLVEVTLSEWEVVSSRS
jgi:hypothetical protein